MYGAPQKITQNQRNMAYWTMWLGAAASVALLASRIAGLNVEKFGPVLGLAAGGMLSVMWNYRMDDYFRALCAKGQQFLTFFMGAYLLILWMDITRLLDFESHWPRHTAAKEETIRVELGITPGRYYQLLNRAIETREALETHPMLVRRLLRLRDQRARAQRRRAG